MATHLPPANGDQAELKCKICAVPIQHFNLGVQICRADAAFWRRCVNENLKFVCANDGRCELNKSSRKCKACRMRMIQRLGARLTNQNGTKSEQSNGRSLKSRSQSPQRVTCSTTHPSPPSSILDSLLEGYEQVLDAQRVLFVAAHPELGFAEQFIMPKESRIIEMHTKCLPLWSAMCIERYGPFRELPSGQKVQTIKSAYQEIVVLVQSELTARFFPQLEDRRIMISNGYFAVMDMERWPAFVEGNVSVERMPEIRQAAEVMFERMFKNVRKFKQLRMRKVDAVVLILFSVFKAAERLNFLTPPMAELKELVLAEWSENVRRHWGEAEGSLQITRIMTFLVDCDTLATALQNSTLVNHIQFPTEHTCCTEQYIEKLSLN
ncbi:hypothetical protein M3Y99_01018800 [Aphelenchoides fujianensis]|nr:hypothetical protein M3Y99_01018800 [Aphelenchoides fujianensis]